MRSKKVKTNKHAHKNFSVYSISSIIVVFVGTRTLILLSLCLSERPCFGKADLVSALGVVAIAW